jgi:hypothetical protein
VVRVVVATVHTSFLGLLCGTRVRGVLLVSLKDYFYFAWPSQPVADFIAGIGIRVDKEQATGLS